MVRFSRVWHPRWTRVLIIGLFIASTAIGASLGLESRHSPATMAAAITPAVPPRPSSARLIDTHVKAPAFVLPQPVPYTPYGTAVSYPSIGIPAAIELVSSNSVSCDLLNHTISRTVFITDDGGTPVVGARVLFTVNRSDFNEPQMVSDVTGFDGSATITVKVPSVSAADKSFATYSILAEAYEVHSLTPDATLRFSISGYTCTGVAGGQ